MKIFKYKIYCETDAKWEYVWLDENQAAPTTCPTDSGHTVTSNSVSISELVGPDIQTLRPFADPCGHRARFKGYSGTAAAGVTTNLDYTLPAERWIDGVELSQDGAAKGDTVHFQIVHPTYGVVDQFGDSWNIDHTSGKQGAVLLSYPAKIPAGLAIRCAYSSTGTDPVWVGVNLRLHMRT